MAAQPGSAQEAEVLKRLEALEARLAALHDRIGDTNTLLQSRLDTKAKPPVDSALVTPSPAEQAGDAIAAAPGPAPSQPGFIRDEATQQIREALLLIETKKYPEAIGELSEFLRDHADHPLAETAQFLLGECYFRQGELQLAREEYQRVLVSYETGAHVPDALARMTEISQKSGQDKESEQHKQVLLAVFPLSPPARPYYLAPTKEALPAKKDAVAQTPETPTADLALPEE